MSRNLLCSLVVVILCSYGIPSAIESVSAGARTGPCDSPSTHGPFTDTLCEGDELSAGEFLEAGDYRLIFDGSGNTYIFDKEQEIVTCAIWMDGMLEAPNELLYVVLPDDTARLVSYDVYDNVDYIISDEHELQGAHWMTLGSDGNLNWKDLGGTRTYHILGPSGECY